MRLGIAILDPNSTLNQLKYLNQAAFFAGDTGQIWMQLVDLDQPLGPANVYSRYMPAAGAALTVNFFSNNDANAFSKVGSQPIAGDPSIWSVSLTSADTMKMAGVNLGIKLVQGASVMQAIARNVVNVAPQSPFQC